MLKHKFSPQSVEHITSCANNLKIFKLPKSDMLAILTKEIIDFLTLCSINYSFNNNNIHTSHLIIYEASELDYWKTYHIFNHITKQLTHRELFFYIRDVFVYHNDKFHTYDFIRDYIKKLFNEEVVNTISFILKIYNISHTIKNSIYSGNHYTLTISDVKYYIDIIGANLCFISKQSNMILGKGFYYWYLYDIEKNVEPLGTILQEVILKRNLLEKFCLIQQIDLLEIKDVQLFLLKLPLHISLN